MIMIMMLALDTYNDGGWSGNTEFYLKPNNRMNTDIDENLKKNLILKLDLGFDISDSVKSILGER